MLFQHWSRPKNHLSGHQVKHGRQMVLAYRYHTLNAIRKPPPDLAHIEEIKQRFMSLRHVFDIKDFVSGWFFGRPWEELRRTNVDNFVAYGFYSSEMSELEPQVIFTPLLAPCHLTCTVFHKSNGCIQTFFKLAAICQRHLTSALPAFARSITSADICKKRSWHHFLEFEQNRECASRQLSAKSSIAMMWGLAASHSMPSLALVQAYLGHTPLA